MIQFNKPTIGKKDLESVLYCMIKDDLAPGEYLNTFTSMLSAELKISNVAAFNTYFHSFETVFHIIDASSGDEVILPSFARRSILNCVQKCRLKPVLVDIEPDSFVPPIEKVKRKLSKNTCCIIIPQMFGIPYDLSAYHEWEIPIVEDIDGCLGSKVNGQAVGSFGTFITMNFNDHSIITTGSGGMIASQVKRLKQLMLSFKRDHGWIDYLMSDFNASLGISQLSKLDKNIATRKKIGDYYDNAVFASNCTLVGREEGKELSYSSYVVKTETPLQECVQFFKKFGIPIRRGIESPLHSFLELDVKHYKNTEEMYAKLIALPIYPTLAREDVENIVKGIKVIL